MTRSMTDRADMVVTPRIDFDFRGLRLSGLDLDDAIQWITEWAHARMRAIVVTPNINHLHLVQSSEEARDAIGRADLQLADRLAHCRSVADPRAPAPGSRRRYRHG